MLAALRAAMTIDAAFFATADPETLLFTGAHSEDPLIAMAPMFLDNELSGHDVNTFPELVRAPGHVRSLDTATRSAWGESPRYRDIMRPVGLGDELRAALVVGGHCWGYLCLHREDGALGFTAAEADVVRRLAPHIAHALRQAILLHRPVPDDERRPGVVLLDEQMELVASTPEADALLPLIGHGSTRLPLPVSVYSVAAALATADQPPSLRVRAATGGWLSLHASRLGSNAQHRRGHRARRAALDAGRAAGRLRPHRTGARRRPARAARRPTKAIANTLHISAHTVQDHLKSVFDKVGVRSRRDLVGRLLAGG